MQILSHRGFWLHPLEKNTKTAFQRSSEAGFGIETDIRDCKGQIVISHDMPKGNEILLEEFIKFIRPNAFPIAFNIKADGLALQVKSILQRIENLDFFVFDMSVPDTRLYMNEEIPFFSRMSEIETKPIWMDKAQGVWLDSFSDIWYNVDFINSLLQQNKKVCIVSPELHSKDHRGLWEMLLPIASSPLLMLCTDYPEKAQKFFRENND